jgi:hypothetical protein
MGQHTGYPPPYQPVRSNSVATAGFVCGLIGFLICLIPFGIFVGGVLAILGIVFGFLGRSRRREPGVSGVGLATTGIVLSILGLVIGVVWLVAIGGAVKKVNDRFHVSSADFTVTQQSCAATTQLAGLFDATGDITNTTGDKKVLVFVHVKVIDSSGRVVGSAEDFAGDVAAHETRAYTAHGTLDDKSVTQFTCTVTVG